MSVAKFLHDYKHLLKSDLVQGSWDDDYDYPRTPAFVVGLLHFFCGVFSIALGIGSICTLATGYFIGYGIWCGFMFLLAGLFACLTCCCINTRLVVTSMVFSILAACAAVVQFSLGVVAAASDNASPSGYGRLNADLLDNVDRFDILYFGQIQRSMCAGSGFNWSQAWGPVDVLLIIVAFVEIALAIITAVLGCRSLCCGTVQVHPSRVLPIISLNSVGELVAFDTSASFVDYSRA